MAALPEPHPAMRSGLVGESSVALVARLSLLIAGLAVVVLLVRRVGFGIVGQMMLRVGWRFPVVSAIYALHVVIRALALWRVLFVSVVPYRDVLRIRLSAEAVETLTFTGPFLAEPAKGWLLARRGVQGSAAFAAVVTEYLLYTFISSIVALAAIILLLARHALPMAARPAAAVVLFVMAAFIGGFVFASLTGIGLIVPTLRAARIVIGQRAVHAADRFIGVEDLIIGFLHDQHRRFAEVLAIETAAQALFVVEIWIVIVGLGFSISWIESLMVEGGVKLVGVAFAFIPGQFGASESIYALLASAIGLPVAAGLSLALVRRLRALPIAVLGLVVGTTVRPE